jgi:hypothetical protein
MESILVFMISIAVIIVSVVTMTMNTIQSTARLSSTWKNLEQRASTVQRTAIVSVPPQSYNGGIIELAVKNEGQVNIHDFSHWDVIVEEQNGSSHYLTFVPAYPPASGAWAVKGIFVTENVPEAFDITILNPGEQVAIGINPDGLIDVGQTIKVTFSTAEGVTSQCYITQQAS